MADPALVMADDERYPDPLPLRTIPVPAEVSAVAGCDCGGVEWHRADGFGQPGCSLWNLPDAERTAAVDAALDRTKAFTAALNARLRPVYGNDAER